MENDSYEPKRFFSLRSGATLLSALHPDFDLLYYRRLEPTGRPFNSIVARKRG